MNKTCVINLRFFNCVLFCSSGVFYYFINFIQFYVFLYVSFVMSYIFTVHA